MYWASNIYRNKREMIGIFRSFQTYIKAVTVLLFCPSFATFALLNTVFGKSVDHLNDYDRQQ